MDKLFDKVYNITMKNFFLRNLKKVWGTMKQKAVTFLPAGLRFGGTEDFFDSLNLGAFRESLYLFIGVSMIRETVSSIPLTLYRITNTSGDFEEVSDNPILDLFERPNNLQTQKEFWKLAVSYYLLAGETFWYLERGDNTGEPTAMVNMRPDFVEILLSAERHEPVAYQFYQSNGTTIKIPVENVLHIKNIDPVNILRGVGVVRPATQRIITEREASKYQALTFRNQGRPDIAVFLDQDLTDEDAADARAKWDKIYGGTDGSKAGFFGNQVKDLKLLNVPPKDMDFMPSLNFLRDDILAALRIPKQMIDTDVNYNNSRVAYATYVRQACEPVLDTFLDVINNKLLVDGKDANLFFDYETNVGEDRELLIKEATELKKEGIIKINEARDIMGYPAEEGGDVFAPNVSPIQLAIKSKKIKAKARLVLKKRPFMVRKFNVIAAVTDLIEAEKAVKRQRNSVFATAAQKEMYIKAFNENIDRKAELFRETVDVYNGDLYKRIMQQIEKIGLTTDNFMDVPTELREAKNIFEPLMKALFEKVGKETMDNISKGFALKASEQFFTADEILRLLELRSEFFVTSMLDTDFDQLRAIITAGLAEGLGVPEIGRKLREYFDDMSVARARTIARTETGRIVSLATNEAYKQSAVVTGKEWLTAGDAKVRPEHQINNGVIVATDGVFPNGEHYPGELSINCRCALAPAV